MTTTMTMPCEKEMSIPVQFTGVFVYKSVLRRIVGCNAYQWHQFVEAFCSREENNKLWKPWKASHKVSPQLAEAMIRYCFEMELGYVVKIDFQTEA